MRKKDLNVLLIVKRADDDKQEIIFGGVFESGIKALEATKNISEHDYWKIEPVKINELRQIRIMWRDCANKLAEDKTPQKESRFAPYIRNLLRKVD